MANRICVKVRPAGALGEPQSGWQSLGLSIADAAINSHEGPLAELPSR